MSRLGDGGWGWVGGQAKQVPEASASTGCVLDGERGDREPTWTRIKGKVQTSKEGISQVSRGSLRVCFVFTFSEKNQNVNSVWCDPYV